MLVLMYNILFQKMSEIKFNDVIYDGHSNVSVSRITNFIM